MEIDNKLMDKFLTKIKVDLINEEDDYSQLKKCESPIEQVMYIALKHALSFLELFNTRFFSLIECQGEIERSKYRTDIVVHLVDEFTFGKPVVHLFAIECDGHEFHEKTKEQARKDKERERTLTERGYTVIRFTGSEIYENPIERAKDAIIIMFKVINKYDEMHLQQVK